MRPMGIADELKLFLPAPSGVSRVFDFTRGPGRAFDQRARELLELLRPHLTRLRQRWERSTEPGCLTNREREVVRLLATGMRNREIADHLMISVGTVRKHLNNIYEKLGVNTRTGAIAAATR
jgi:DNA-binding CsgD family transcriptional regulator